MYFNIKNILKNNCNMLFTCVHHLTVRDRDFPVISFSYKNPPFQNSNGLQNSNPNHPNRSSKPISTVRSLPPPNPHFPSKIHFQKEKKQRKKGGKEGKKKERNTLFFLLVSLRIFSPPKHPFHP